MNRYLLFAGSSYYPKGGWSDYQGSFDFPQTAIYFATVLNEGKWDWFHVVAITNDYSNHPNGMKVVYPVDYEEGQNNVQ